MNRGKQAATYCFGCSRERPCGCDLLSRYPRQAPPVEPTPVEVVGLIFGLAIFGGCLLMALGCFD